ncbi:MAG: GNAT family N-acetyltransferase [Candidatus Brocadiae bacterium]|nr:GNAT family N-acetyltransferase [Candidatus Brocadiia bacterium]
MAIEGPRALRKGELRSGVELADRVFRVGWDSSMEGDYPVVFCEDNLEGLRVFVDEGKVISLVGMVESPICLLGTSHRGCCIGAVCTEPDYRGQGLATRLLIDAREKALADGVDIFAITGGRGLYRRQGYVDVGGYHVCTIERSRLPSTSRGIILKKEGYVLRPWRVEDVPALVRIRSAEPVRFVRTPEDFLTILSSGNVSNRTGETRVVCKKGSDVPVAYVSYHIGGAPRQDKDPNAVTVMEVGGPRWAIVQALGRLMDEGGLDDVTLHYLDCDAEMVQMVGSFGWRSEPRGFLGTAGIIDPARFWQACAPLVREMLGHERSERLGLSADGSVTVTYGDEALVLDGMSAFTRLVFLPQHRRGELELGLPGDSELAGVLDEVFPLPLMDYGLDYI